MCKNRKRWKIKHLRAPSLLLQNIAAKVEHSTSQETRSSCKKMKRKKNPMVENSSMRQAKDSPDVGEVFGDAIALQSPKNVPQIFPAS